MSYPDDENGDVLRMMLKNGDDLSIPREIDFSVIFPTEDAAIKFAVHALKNELKVSFAPYEGNDEMPWQVQAHVFMLPTHENITGFELLLAEQSAEYGGQNDGWGSMSQGKDS
jgi:Regulator of ribonuclease activity B